MESWAHRGLTGMVAMPPLHLSLMLVSLPALRPSCCRLALSQRAALQQNAPPLLPLQNAFPMPIYSQTRLVVMTPAANTKRVRQLELWP